MQPMLVISAPAQGMAYVNGRFAGECGPEEPLYVPVAPRGAVYLEYRPLEEGGYRALARRVTLSGGRPLECPDGLYCVRWPGGVVEVELSPGREVTGPVRRLYAGDVEICLRPGVDLETAGGRFTLPPGADAPEISRAGEGWLLLGECGEGRYALLVSGDGASAELLTGSRISVASDGRVTVIADLQDTVGHARIEHWRALPGAVRLSSEENAWTEAGPHWPRTAGQAATAALEAAMIGLEGESDGYLSPEKRGMGYARTHLKDAFAVGEMRFAPPDARSCVALFVRESGNLARAEPLFFRASPALGRQGSWQIERFGAEM